MRISPAGLLVVLAFAVPALVQARTVLAFAGVHVSPLQTVLIGLLVLTAVVLWAVAPGSGTEAPSEPNGG